MRKNIRNPFSSNYIKKLLPFILFSCVYYNTFYNAEVYFDKAQKIIEQTLPSDSNEDKIPAQAKKLLGQAIENSNIVLDSYPESKYVDDAYFIIGKASFLRKEFFSAERHLSKLIELYPDSEYYSEAQIWLIYTYLKMGNIDLAKNKLDELDPIKNNKDLFLINNILAEISIVEKDPMLTYNYYNKCISFTDNNSQRTAIYLKLFNISKQYNHLDSLIAYIDRLSDYTTGQMKKQMKLDWIKYSREAKKFDDLLIEIDAMLADSEYSSIYIKLELERAKIYLAQNDFESAKIYLVDLSDKYSRKSESAEALYHLGYIALMENFDLDLALEYFERSKKDRKTSLYGKRSREMINKINDYKNLNQEFDYLVNEKDEEDDSFNETINRNIMPKPKATKAATPDSLLFAISEKLLFDFDRLDDAKINYEDLIKTYTESKFRPQALYVLNFYFPDEGWGDLLSEEYPDSDFNLDKSNVGNDDIDSRRDQIWVICDNSYKLCSQEFLKLYEIENDLSSLYFYSFINDKYLNNIENAIDGYNRYVSVGENVGYLNEANSRLNEIENNIYSLIELSNQKINYYNALKSLWMGEELDSVLTKIDGAKKGSFSKFKSSAQLISSKLSNLNNFKERIMDDSYLIDSITVRLPGNIDSKMDSIYFIIGKIYQLDFTMNDSASIYFEKIINDFSGSNFRYQSMTALNDINSNRWREVLLNEYPDSLYISDSSYKEITIISDIYDEKFIDNEINRLEELNIFSDFFIDESDTISIADTTNIKLDTLNRDFEINE